MLSSNDPGYKTTVSPVAANPIFTFPLGLFSEDEGEHYVCLTDESDLNELDNVAECLSNVGYSASCRGVSQSSDNGENPVNGIGVCVDNQNSGDDDQASASRENTEYDDQGSVGGINSGDGDQASVDRQNSGEDDQVSVGGQDPGNRNEVCQNRSSTEPRLNPDILEEIVRQTLRLYLYMRSSLRAVSRFFRNIVK